MGFKGEGVEGADGDMLVGLEVVVVEAEGGGVFVEVAACDFYVEGEFHMWGGVLLGRGIEVSLVGDVRKFKFDFETNIGGFWTIIDHVIKYLTDTSSLNSDGSDLK